MRASASARRSTAGSVSRAVGASCAAALALVAGCGWSTALDDYAWLAAGDASLDAPRPDAGRRDAGPCAVDRDCDDRLFCNGEERCVSGRCVDGAPVVCEDRDPCTDSRCDEGSQSCVATILDRDGDGFPDARCGGGDCTDSNPSIYPGAPEQCVDGLDFDCNGFSGCGDPSCFGSPRCMSCPGDPSRMEDCFNNVDDDGDCRVDCLDEACSGLPECAGRCPDQELGSMFGPGVARGDTTASPRRRGGSCGGFEAPEVIFGWTAPWTGSFTFDTVGSGYDTLLYLIDGSCDGPEIMGACNDDTFGVQSRVTAFLFEGQRIAIVVDGYGSSSGYFVLNVTEGGSTESGFCFDGADNDADGLWDCEDPDCFPECGMTCMPFEVCFDGRDNDCNGLWDCDDPACFPDCGMECTPFEICSDGRDNDCDGLWDCDDDECRASPECCRPRPERCANGADDDCDGQIDCGDPDCFGTPRCGAPVDAGVDGGTCTPRELGVAACTDRSDNDCDGRGDCGDPDCSPFGPGSECCNGLDDDGDGMIDLFTCRCFDDSTCAGVGSLEQICWTRTYSVCAPRCEFVGGDAFCRDLIGPGTVCREGECVPVDGPPPPMPPPPPR